MCISSYDRQINTIVKIFTELINTVYDLLSNMRKAKGFHLS